MAESAPERIDRYLVRTGAAPSRRAAAELIAAGRVRIDGRRCRKGDAVGPGAQVEVTPDRASKAREPVAIAPNPALGVQVLYCDGTIVVANKPGAMPCHPLRADERGTAMNAIVARFPETAVAGDNQREGGLVHRLDNGTSGALMVARTKAAFAAMRSAVRAGKVARRYLALVAGVLDAPCELSIPIAHNRRSPRRMVAGDELSLRRSRAGRAAFTRIEPIRRAGEFTLVAAIPRTGSRHQIRVHLADAGHPIAGDTMYGGAPMQSLEAGRFFLHLAEIEFESPERGRVKVRAPLPPDLESVLAQI